MKSKILLLIIFLSFNLVLSQKAEKKKPERIPNAGSSPVGPKAEIKKNNSIDPNQIYTEVEQLSEFPGGIRSLREKIINAFDRSKITEIGILKTQITFVVEKSGTLTDLKAQGDSKEFNEETIRALKSIKDLWSPAKIDNKAVRYLYRVPVKMEF